MKRNFLAIFAVVVLACAVLNAGVLDYDAESLGVGGAFTAVSRKATSILWNPASLMLEQKRGGFDFQLTGGAGVNFTGNILENVNNIADLSKKFTAINDAQKNGGSIDISQISALTLAMKNINDLGSGAKGMLLSGGGGMFLRVGKMAFSVNNYVMGGVKPYTDMNFWLGSGTVTSSSLPGLFRSNLSHVFGDSSSGIIISSDSANTSPTDTATRDLLATQLGWMQADLQSAGVVIPPGITPTQLANILIKNAVDNNVPSTDIQNAVQTIADNRTIIEAVLKGSNPMSTFSANQSNIMLKGINVTELSAGSAWPLPLKELYLGVNLKLLSGTAAFYKLNVFKENAKIDDFSTFLTKNTKQSIQPGIDVGLLYDKSSSFLKSRFGLMAKNINRPKFDMPDEAKKSGENEIYLDPQVRAGAAYFPFNFWTISTDVDLTKNSSFVPGYENQTWALGTELNLINKKWFNLALRAGMMKNLARSDNPVYSGGIGLNILHLVIDISGALDTRQTKINSTDSVYSSGSAALSVSLYF
jgi:hypothetical protein